MKNREVLLVRHGDYNFDGKGGLSAEGKEQSKKAQHEIISRQIGVTAIILSSDILRARQTAEIISEGLTEKYYLDPYLGSQGLNPSSQIRASGNLDNLLYSALSRAGLNENSQEPLIVVTHAPLIAAALRTRDIAGIGYGAVIEYSSSN